MTALANERIAYFNGDYVPESEVRVPFRDRSWIFGDGAFDMTRTFNGRLFKIREHVERLYRSLKVLRIDPGLSPAEMIAISEEVNGRNLHLLGPDEDQWVGQRISRGVNAVEGDNWDHYGPTVIVESMPLPFKARARLYRDGIDVAVPSVRRVSPDALTPRAKTHNYLNLITGDLEVHAHSPEAWTILLDVNGNLCEGLGANIFVYKDGRLLTPHERYVLPGRQPRHRDRARSLGKNPVRRGRHRPLRRLCGRGSLHHLDQLLHLPDPHDQRHGHRHRPGPRPDHQTPDRRLRPPGRLRLRRPVPEAPRRLS